MVTRYTVELERGGDLQLIRQNTESTRRGLPERGREVVVGWRPEHAVAVRGDPLTRRDHREKGFTPGTDGLARHRRAAGDHAAVRRLRLQWRTARAAAKNWKSSARARVEVNLISWAGYVEPAWTKPFEQKTGCKVNDKVGGTSDEMVQLMRTGEYDGVSASGNATARLVEGGDVDPVNVDLVPNYKTVFSDLKDQPYNTFDGKPYGIPHGRGANLLMWNTSDVTPAPKSWEVTMDPKVAGQIQGQDQPLRRSDVDRRSGRLPEDA